MGSFNGNIGTPSEYFNLLVEYSIEQNTENNYSVVTATAYVKRNNTYASPYNSRSEGALSINGVEASYTGAYDLRTDGYKQIMANAVRVYHNDDGTKTTNITFSFNGKLSSYYPTGSISQNITLPTIPRSPSYNSISSSYVTETSVYLSASIDTKGLSITDGGWDLSTDWGSTWTYYSGNPTGRTISGLSPNTQYWYRGYVVTNGGGSNSDWGTFRTYAYPSFTTNPSVESITETTAILNRGVANINCTYQYSWNNSTWNTLSNQTLTLTGLNPGTNNTIYVRIVSTATGSIATKTLTFTTLDYVMKTKISGLWKNAVPYIKINGSWKKTIPYIKVNGTWKEGKQ